jgi:(R,R)-butanediol dehydrogenase/meso-butanediol dehydrogenase/diacetyl reductase|tara:strand:- start:2047 stop:3096 length:1050 start_codon:yes stop_codon:yes gene_type:complete
MHSVHYLGDRLLVVAQGDSLPPRPGEVRIDVAYTGICGTDLTVFNGKMDARVTMPAVLGHEMSGRVAELGEGVTGWAAGDAVTVLPLDWCGQCPACIAGHHHLCHRLKFLGIDADGSMQNSWTVPATALVALPPDLDLRHGAMVEPLAVAVHDVARAQVSAGDRVLVVGGGPVGLLIAMVSRVQGAEVRISEPDPTRRSIARELGFETIDPAQEDLGELVASWTEQAGVDIAFEVSGSSPGLSAAVAALKVRGRLALVGVHTTPVTVDLFRFFWRELELLGARLYQRGDFDAAVALITSGQVTVAPLLSKVVGLDEAPDAFRSLESGGVMKVLVDCGTRQIVPEHDDNG